MADTFLMSTSPQPRRYRMVDQQGQPHPELDEHVESSEGAWDFARRWWSRTGESRDGHPDNSPIGLGVEVSTESGHWRTLRHPQG